ncbi:NAD-dependent DNA ligase LigA [symbiont of Argiope bruennichi]|uniref:NAD-dependent DNA ligase LigA n=1 Tax=symbiont of Argiope bruennichi TaxID=2810479 RepID=UPI003DA51287
MNKNLEKIKELTKKINFYNHEYYVNNNSLISDYEFDRLLEQLIELEKKYPEFIQKDSPTQNVGFGNLKIEQKVIRNEPMLSIQNVFSYDQLKKFLEKIQIFFANEKEEINFFCELKIDGVSFEASYKNKILETISTRGNGYVGENITYNQKLFIDLPKKISEFPNCAVRGEAYYPKNEFIKYFQKEKNLSNPRNFASGIIRTKHQKYFDNFFVKTFIYYLKTEKKINYQSEIIKNLQKEKFSVNEYGKICKNFDEIKNFIENIDKIKDELPYLIDGVVIKLNNLLYCKRIGMTSKYPRYMVAYKFLDQKYTTKVEDIIANIGRSGKVTYIAKVTPILIDNSLVSNCTLHNINFIKKMNIGIGSMVEIIKSGKIIPKVIKKVSSSTNEKPFLPISLCPSCNSEIFFNEKKTEQFCLNINCPAIIKRSLIHFCSKEAMNISGLGKKYIEYFYRENIIKKIQDIFLLKNIDKEKIFNLNLLIKEKKWENLLKEIENSKSNPFETVLFSLGIKGIGKENAKNICLYFKNINNLINASESDLLKVQNIGKENAKNIVDFFKLSENLKLVNFLIANNLNFETVLKEADEKIIKHPFFKKTFLITGTFKITRNELKSILKRYNVNIKNGISKTIDFVLVGDDPGNKKEKALKLGLKIIEKNELYKILEM